MGPISWKIPVTQDGEACINPGDTAFMLYASLAVFLMTPAAGLQQAGMLRRKNALTMLMQVLVGCMAISLAWFAVGFSVAFGTSLGGLFGAPWSAPFLVDVPVNGCFTVAPHIPALVFVAFQMQFAVLTPLVLSAAWAERLRFEGAVVAATVWVLVVYAPIVHWFWADGGFLRQLGAIDFAGGFVVHGSSGVGGLLTALALSPRRIAKTLGVGVSQHHDLPIAFWGSMLTLACWYSFNGGSAYAAGGQAGRALMSTHLASATGVLTMLMLERYFEGSWSFIAALSGIVSGCGSVTAGSGFIEPWSAVVLGACGATGAWYVSRQVRRWRVDDPLDCFAGQAVPGIVGGVGVALFAHTDTEQRGIVYAWGEAGAWRLLGVQLLAAVCVCAWAALGTYVLFRVLRKLGVAEISAELESLGLDVGQLGISAYDMDALGNPTQVARTEGELLSKRLRDAAKEGDVGQLRQLVPRLADTTAPDFEGRTALFFAARSGNAPAVRVLLTDPLAPINVADRFGVTPLAIARRRGHAPVVALLAAAGASDFVGEDLNDALMTALHMASRFGNADALQRCLEVGAAVDAVSWDGAAPLHVAVRHGHVACVRVLLACHASPGIRDVARLLPDDAANVLALAAPEHSARTVACVALVRRDRHIRARTIGDVQDNAGSAAPGSATAGSTAGTSPVASPTAGGAIASSASSASSGALALTPSSARAGGGGGAGGLLSRIRQLSAPAPPVALSEPLLTADEQGETDDGYIQVVTIADDQQSLLPPQSSSSSSSTAMDIAGKPRSRGKGLWSKAREAYASPASSPSSGAAGSASGAAGSPPSGPPRPASLARMPSLADVVVAAVDTSLDAQTVEEVMETSSAGDLEGLRRLKRRGAAIALARNETGGGPLHLAARGDHLDVVRWLTERRAMVPTAKDFLGRTPIFEAIVHGSLQVLSYFLDGANDSGAADENGSGYGSSAAAAAAAGAAAASAASASSAAPSIFHTMSQSRLSVSTTGPQSTPKPTAHLFETHRELIAFQLNALVQEARLDEASELINGVRVVGEHVDTLVDWSGRNFLHAAVCAAEPLAVVERLLSTFRALPWPRFAAAKDERGMTPAEIADAAQLPVVAARIRAIAGDAAALH